MTKSRLAGFAAVAVTVAVWASGFPAIRVALHSFDAVQLSWLRLLIASVSLAALAPILHLRPPERGQLPRILLSGLFGMTLLQLLLNTGETSVAAGVASILIATSPVFTALLARVYLGERLRWLGYAGIAIAAVGVVVVSWSRVGGASPGLDVLALLGSALSQALFFVIQRPLLRRRSSFEVTSYSIWAGMLLASPLVLHGLPIRLHPVDYVPVLWLGIFSSALGYLAWSVSVGRLPVSVASACLYAVPAVALLISAAWIAEWPTPIELVGGAIIIAGVIVVASAGQRDAVAEFSGATPRP